MGRSRTIGGGAGIKHRTVADEDAAVTGRRGSGVGPIDNITSVRLDGPRGVLQDVRDRLEDDRLINAAGRDVRGDRHVSAEDPDGSGNGDGRTDRDGRSVARLAKREARQRRSVGVSRRKGRGEASRNRLDRRPPDAGEAGGRRRHVATEDDPAGVDRRDTGEGRGTREDHIACPGLGDAPCPADGAGEGEFIGTIETQHALGDDIAGKSARGAARADA